MKLRSLLFCCCLALAGVACEEIVDDPGALPYHEKLVIRGVLENNKQLDTIKITRTLPPLDEYSEERAVVQNALVLVRHDGIVDTLIDHGNSQYFTPGIIVRSGSVYELTVEWKGKRATAVTTIPQPPVIQSARRVNGTSSSGYSSAYLADTVLPRSAEVYAATSLFRYPPPNQNLSVTTNFFYEVKRPANNETALAVRAFSYWEEVTGTEYIIVHSYDAPFYEYYTSLDQDSEDLFGASGRQVKWNIQGDGIGMFIGTASSEEFRVP